VILPPLVDELVRELIASHRGHAAIGQPDSTPWLFPGGRPGQHIGHDRLGQRLKNIGLQPGKARSTALFALAAEVPAAILARMLGIHIQVATQWQQATAGDWAAYAADLSQRTLEKTENPGLREPRTVGGSSRRLGPRGRARRRVKAMYEVSSGTRSREPDVVYVNEMDAADVHSGKLTLRCKQGHETVVTLPIPPSSCCLTLAAPRCWTAIRERRSRALRALLSGSRSSHVAFFLRVGMWPPRGSITGGRKYRHRAKDRREASWLSG
jgi:hypothetical protein